MKIGELMTEHVVTVAPGATLKEAAVLLARHRISGLPVIDPDRRVVGIVSEGDFLEKQAGERPRQGPLRRLLKDDRPDKLEARTVGEAMTALAITIGARHEAARAAQLMVEHKVNRLPVVDDEKRLLGIVTRADLVRAFVRADEEIERELRDDVVRGALWTDPRDVEITVRRGEVTLAGELDTKADAQLLESFAARVPGVVSVRSELSWRRDEVRLPRSQPYVPIPPRR